MKNQQPILMTGDLTDALASLPDQCVDAVLALVPVQRPPQGANQYTIEKRLDDTLLDETINHLKRVSRGPIALLLIHAVEQWSTAFARAGLHVTQETYSDCMDVIVAHTSPVKLPPADTCVLEPLVHSLISIISKDGDTLLNHCGHPALPSLCIHASGRKLVAITATEDEREDLNDALNGEEFYLVLSPQQVADVRRRRAEGETYTSIAQSYGKCTATIRRAVA